jgi:hypothetical protein
MWTSATTCDTRVAAQVFFCMSRVGAVLLLLLACADALGAQELRSLERRIEVELWGGLAQGSPQWGVLGETPGMNVALLGLRLARPTSFTGPGTADRLTTVHLDIIPLALVSTPYTSLRGAAAANCNPDALCLQPGTNASGLFPNGSAVGVGVSPLGMTTHFRRTQRVSPSVGLTGGALYFDRRVPTTRGAAFNFTATLETALRVGDPDRSGFVLSYRFHHISNAGFAHENPGVASHLLTVGLRSGRARMAPHSDDLRERLQ